METVNFVAIDFETATSKRNSICEAGICVVRGGNVVETRSWLVRPENNDYSWRNIEIHGIYPEETQNAPEFPAVWNYLFENYLAGTPTLVAHNAAFDISCIRKSLDFYALPKPEIDYFCSLKIACNLYDVPSHSLDFLCSQMGIDCRNHHRAGADAEMCARLFLREISDLRERGCDWSQFCCGEL